MPLSELSRLFNVPVDQIVGATMEIARGSASAPKRPSSNGTASVAEGASQSAQATTSKPKDKPPTNGKPRASSVPKGQIAMQILGIVKKAGEGGVLKAAIIEALPMAQGRDAKEVKKIIDPIVVKMVAAGDLVTTGQARSTKYVHPSFTVPTTN